MWRSNGAETAAEHSIVFCLFFFFNDTATTEIYTLSLHDALPILIKDYTVCPIFMEAGKPGGHQWLIEFSKEPHDMDNFSAILDQQLRLLNSDYDAKRTADIALAFPDITRLEVGTFEKWLKNKGKLGGQHKVPRLSNYRNVVEEILTLEV